MNKTLQISSRAFWDVDFEKLMWQADNYPEFIIKKVFEHGKFDDVVAVINYFGKQKVIDTLTNTSYLPAITLHFASAIFKIEKEKFKCYTKKVQKKF
jgi:hypothetical protein